MAHTAIIGLIDFYLEDQLNLTEAGKYADIAQASLPMALEDEKASASWKLASYDVNLRVGIVNFCQGKGGVAAEAFEAARKLTTDKTATESLDNLITAAKAGKSVIPDDVRGSGAGEMKAAGSAVSPSDKAALALSMGVIYLPTGRTMPKRFLTKYWASTRTIAMIVWHSRSSRRASAADKTGVPPAIPKSAR